MNENTPSIIFPLDEPISRFDDHLQISGNKFILVSGKFGSGKSFFLDQYFNQHRDNQYNSFFINPVNYVVSDNIDIFELIKVDIVSQMFLNQHILIGQNLDFSKFDPSILYIQNNILQFLESFAKILALVNPSVGLIGSGLKTFNELTKKFSEFIKKFSKEMMPPNEVLEEFWESMRDEKGTSFEKNVISQLISDILLQIKSDDKENVLIIDDLDRLDPDHLFRLLNVFSAHRDPKSDEDKYGFDKIILVGDLQNIKYVFHHRYGESTDFTGYIDKFFSILPFEFSNKDAVQTYLRSLHKSNNKFGSKDLEYESIFLTEILTHLIQMGAINLRSLVKNFSLSEQKVPKVNIYEYFFPNNDLQYSKTHINLFFDHEIFSGRKPVFISSEDIPFLGTLKKLIYILGGEASFSKTMGEMVENEDKSREISENRQFIEVIERLILPAYHVSKNSDSQITSIFYSLEEKEGKRHIGYPKGNFRGIDYRLILNWSRGNIYKGEDGLFKNSRVHLTLDYNKIPESFTYHAILKETLDIYWSLKKNGVLGKIRMT